ncbi:MAG: hypothetical protein AAF322_00200, partial [Pseudomonadota bacterium]
PLRFLDDGRRLVVAERSGARIYDLETGTFARLRENAKIDTHAVSPDGSLIAFGGDDFVSVWSVEPRARLARIDGLERGPIAFAGPEGRTLVHRTRGAVSVLRWDPEALIEIACEVHAADRWTGGRLRLSGGGEPRCAPAPLARR